jgi:RND family efflux transporter MFP subunit
MKSRIFLVLGGMTIAVSGLAAFVALSSLSGEATPARDPRQDPPAVRLSKATALNHAERSFTGVIGAKVESDLGFRVPGKIVERLVSAGQQVQAGQALMRIDDTDLRLVLSAKRNAVEAARASSVQLEADEQRKALLLKDGWISKQRYDQAKAAADAAKAQLAAAQAEAEVAGNGALYSVLVAGAEGTIMETLGEPGQVVSAGQPVVRLAQSGPREAVVALPEMLRPAIGSPAAAEVYGRDGKVYGARLRQLSDTADAQTRTYEARYVLDGEASSAPLGSTVTIRLTSGVAEPQVQVPLGALLDDGQKTGVWTLDEATSTVRFHPVKLVRVTDDSAVISGLNADERVVSPGAQLLHEGAPVKVTPEGSGT